jgi:predicted PurR-regulated permease PerM
MDRRESPPAQRLPTLRPPLPAVEAATTEASARPARLTPLSLLLVLIVAYLLMQIQFVVVLVLLSLVFATVIHQPVDALERRHVPRPLAILLVYVTLIGALAVLFAVLSPVIQDQATAFRDQAPASLGELRSAWQASPNPLLHGPAEQLLGRAIAFIQEPGAGISLPQGAAIGLLTGLGGGIVGIGTVLIISFYYLLEKSWIRQIVLLNVSPERRARIGRIWDEVEQKVGDWLRGQLTLCLLIGIPATIGYGLMGINFWPLLGLWAGLTEIVPILGPWLGGIPAFVIALTQSWQQALLVACFVVVLQLTENAILVPRVMRGAVGLTPLTVFIAILAGTEFAGIGGALLAIPVAAAIQVLISDHTAARREAKLAGLAALPGWRWMRGAMAPPAFAPGVPEPMVDSEASPTATESPLP